jgi:F0F1-type ATP synthase membrane subunit b/b'
MFAFIKFTFLLFAEEAGHTAAAGGNFYSDYLNYPGFEAWKFINLFIFVGALVYLLRKPLSTAFKARRENIRRELIQAKAEKDAAMEKLAAVEARLAKLDTETAQIRENARLEAEAESRRIAEQTVADVEKIRDNARREIAATGSNARQQLRRFSAEESIRLAEEMLKNNLKSDDAVRLVDMSISNLGNNGGVSKR